MFKFNIIFEILIYLNKFIILMCSLFKYQIHILIKYYLNII